jgi:hypothetical protein
MEKSTFFRQKLDHALMRDRALMKVPGGNESGDNYDDDDAETDGGRFVQCSQS